ncbi:MAG TPA: SEC-C metal-binding domain-containing protein [Bryobacteraceae bacterium]|jgi:transposase-like protein
MSDFALTPQQLKVIEALSSGVTVTQAARDAGVHRNTINYWRRNLRAFRDALADAQYDRALYFREQLEGLTGLAIQAVRDLLADPKTSPAVRLKAALAVIQTATFPPVPKQEPCFRLETAPLPKSAQSEMPPEPEPEPEPQSEPEFEFLHKTEQHTNPNKTGRNELCPCGSGQKYKRCCLNKSSAAQAA